MLPSQFPQFVAYPAVHDFVKRQLDMQFNDVRAMMRLPLPELWIDAGCNFATVATLCNLIGGISVVLYRPNDIRRKKARNDDREYRFKKLLEEFYPWAPSENTRASIEILYEVIRNPLVHALGVRREGRRRRVMIAKSPLREDQIEEIERSDIRPDWVPPTVMIAPTRHTINVWGLYWGVFHLVQRLAKDINQMREAEKRIRSGKIVDRN